MPFDADDLVRIARCNSATTAFSIVVASERSWAVLIEQLIGRQFDPHDVAVLADLDAGNVQRGRLRAQAVVRADRRRAAFLHRSGQRLRLLFDILL